MEYLSQAFPCEYRLIEVKVFAIKSLLNVFMPFLEVKLLAFWAPREFSSNHLAPSVLIKHIMTS